MITLSTYRNVLQANRDKGMLESSGIPVSISGDDSASAGYGTVLGEIILQVQEKDEEQARKIINDHEGFLPLPDDFVPPPLPPEPRDSQLGTMKNRSIDVGIIVILTLLVVFVMLAAFSSRSQKRSTLPSFLSFPHSSHP